MVVPDLSRLATLKSQYESGLVYEDAFDNEIRAMQSDQSNKCVPIEFAKCLEAAMNTGEESFQMH